MNIVISNHKGGVGKTTTALNLAAALGEKGESCLLIDLDPQASLTISLGLNPDDFQTTVYNSLIGNLPLASLIQNLSIKNVSLIPSNIDLSGAEVELQSILSRENKLFRLPK